MDKKIYLDYNATTPCDPIVVDHMLPFFNDKFGNPSSSHHAYGWIARDAVSESAKSIAHILGVSASTLTFTSGATEGANMILKSFAGNNKQSLNHIITCKTEHKAVLDTCQMMESTGQVDVTYLDVDDKGLIDLDELKASLRPETVLIAIMHANNETGTIQPLGDIKKIIEGLSIKLFTDATQSLGKVPLDEVFEVADYACFSGHKLYGPKGIGLVYAKSGKEDADLKSLIQGGGQQKRMRGGTLNTPSIAGFAKAVELAYSTLDEEQARLSQLRNRLESGLLNIELSRSNSQAEKRLPNTTNISFSYVDGFKLLSALSKNIAVSNGSACNSSNENPSHVLTAMGITEDLAFSSLRISLGKYTTESEVDRAIDVICEEVGKLRADNILWERRVI
jgi:cysteine desulfurase